MYCCSARKKFHGWGMLTTLKLIFFTTILNHLIMEKKIKQKIIWFFFFWIVRNSFFLIFAWFTFIFNLKACEKHQLCIFKTLDYPLTLKNVYVTYLMIESLYSWNEIINHIYKPFRILFFYFFFCFCRLSFAPVQFANRDNSSKIEIAMKTE